MDKEGKRIAFFSSRSTADALHLCGSTTFSHSLDSNSLRRLKNILEGCIKVQWRHMEVGVLSGGGGEVDVWLMSKWQRQERLQSRETEGEERKRSEGGGMKRDSRTVLAEFSVWTELEMNICIMRKGERGCEKKKQKQEEVVEKKGSKFEEQKQLK